MNQDVDATDAFFNGKSLLPLAWEIEKILVWKFIFKTHFPKLKGKQNDNNDDDGSKKLNCQLNLLSSRRIK